MYSLSADQQGGTRSHPNTFKCLDGFAIHLRPLEAVQRDGWCFSSSPTSYNVNGGSNAEPAQDRHSGDLCVAHALDMEVAVELSSARPAEESHHKVDEG